MSSNLLRVVQEQQETIEKQSRLIADLIATLESWEQTAGYDGEELKERAKRFAIKRKAGFMNMTITEFIEAAAHNKIIQLVRRDLTAAQALTGLSENTYFSGIHAGNRRLIKINNRIYTGAGTYIFRA